MNTLIAERLSSHLLADPAASVVEAARHMAATQAQEFWGGRFALAVRTARTPTAAEVDAQFDAGMIVRTWPMRGTLHVVAAQDVAWMLSVTHERVFRSAAGRHRQLGLDADDFARAERVLRRVLGRGALPRSEALAALLDGGVDPAGQRGAHLILALAIRGVVHWGATVPRAAGQAATQQLLTLNDALPAQAIVSDAPAELFRRYLVGHGPASVADFAWWSGLPITQARAAAEGVAPDSDGRYRAPSSVGSADPAPTHILASFDEYYISYADRSTVADDDARAAIGPGRNGMVLPIMLRAGRAAAVWTRSGQVRRSDPALTAAQSAALINTWRAHIAG